MYPLGRWDPMRDMMSLRQAMDRLMESAFIAPGEQMGAAGGVPLDVKETEDAYEIKALIPGVNPDDLNITFENNTLTIQGEMKHEEEREGETYHLREMRRGAFSRSLTLPDQIRADAIEAQCENGMLTLRLPKAEEAKPKRIQVRGGGQPQQRTIEAKGQGQGQGKK